MVELVDTGDLKSPDLIGRTGSSPVPGISLLPAPSFKSSLTMHQDLSNLSFSRPSCVHILSSIGPPMTRQIKCPLQVHFGDTRNPPSARANGGYFLQTQMTSIYF